jgi:hypothetical protein
MLPDPEAFADVVIETIILALAPARARFAEIDERFGRVAMETALLVTRELGAMRERVAVVEVKPLIPGPIGPAGRDGVDGVGFDDLIVEHDGERTFTFKAVRGDVVKALGTFTLPIPIYRKVWIEGRTYEPCDRVTWAGSEWHCETATTTKPGDGSKAWVLSVKHGRDAKDGRDGAVGPPGPRGPGWEETMDERRRR